VNVSALKQVQGRGTEGKEPSAKTLILKTSHFGFPANKLPNDEANDVTSSRDRMSFYKTRYFLVKILYVFDFQQLESISCDDVMS
jgi:hypothetical protein